MGKGTYSNTLQELRETKNFAKLATVYRHMAKFRDSIAAAAPNVPNQILDPTLKHLDATLKDYRDLASEITGFPIDDKYLKDINFGDEFGSAATSDTGQFAGLDTSQIEVVRGLAGRSPFMDADLDPATLAEIAVMNGPQGTLFGNEQGGVLSYVTRDDMRSTEARRMYEALAGIPVMQEARGCLDRWIIGAVGIGGVLLLAIVGAWFALRGGDDGDSDEVVAGETPAATATVDDGDAPGILDGFSDETRADLAYFSPSFAGYQVEASYVVADETDDAFNSFGDVVVFEDDLTELVAGYGGRLNISQQVGLAFICGEQTSTGMTVVCAEGVTGALPPGDYVTFIGSVERPLDNWKASVEYKYSTFIEDRGRTLAFPDGDPRPEFPYNTLIRTNSYFSLGSVGGSDWALTTRWSDGQQFRPWSEAPATDNAESYVRGVLGGNTFMFLAPSELYSDMLYYNVGTEAHPGGEDYTAQNTTQDVLGDNPQGMKTQVYNWLDPDFDDEDAPRIIGLLRERLPQYATWIREGNGAEVASHLNRSALLRWGDETCDGYFSRIGPDATFGLEIIDARGPVIWDWEIYGIKVGTLFDVYEFDVNLTQQGATSQITGHFAWDDESEDIRIFSPCVTAEDAAAELAAAQAPPDSSAPGGGAPATGAAVDRIRELLPAYELSRRNGEGALYDFLHPVVIEYYGEAVCRDFYANQIGPDPAFAFVNIGMITGPETYTYMPQGELIGTADDVYSFQIDTTIGTQTSTFTWRFALIGDALKVFQRCAR